MTNKNKMEEVFFCGLTARKMTSLIGWSQMVFFGLASVLFIPLMTQWDKNMLDKDHNFAEVSMAGSVEGSDYANILSGNRGVVLLNFLIAAACGNFLVAGVKQNLDELLIVWLYYLVVCCLANFIVTASVSLGAGIVFTSFFLGLCCFPVTVVLTLIREIHVLNDEKQLNEYPPIIVIEPPKTITTSQDKQEK